VCICSSDVFHNSTACCFANECAAGQQDVGAAYIADTCRELGITVPSGVKCKGSNSTVNATSASSASRTSSRASSRTSSTPRGGTAAANSDTESASPGLSGTDVAVIFVCVLVGVIPALALAYLVFFRWRRLRAPLVRSEEAKDGAPIGKNFSFTFAGASALLTSVAELAGNHIPGIQELDGTPVVPTSRAPVTELAASEGFTTDGEPLASPTGAVVEADPPVAAAPPVADKAAPPEVDGLDAETTQTEEPGLDAAVGISGGDGGDGDARETLKRELAILESRRRTLQELSEVEERQQVLLAKLQTLEPGDLPR
jgi:hypothetical protein